MRIVYVLTSLGMGGAERQVLALGSRMAERGHTVALLVLRPEISEEWPTALDVLHLDMRKTPLSFLASILRARKFLKSFRPDIVHSHSFHANIVARLLRILAPAQVISTVHNVFEGGWTRMFAYRLTDSLSLTTTAVSSAAAVQFVRLKAIPQHKCIVLTNGIETAEFSPHAGRRTQMRATMGVTDEFIWIAAGRIVPAKDIPNLLRAFNRVLATIPHAQLWIAGEGNLPGVKGAAASAVAPGSTDHVRWLGLRRDLPALLDAAEGFVSASAWEGMPLVVGEAMAMQKPVVATDVGGVRELVGDAGVLVPAGDSRALAKAMIECMQRSAADRHTLGFAARQRIVTKFGMDARADEWEALYRSLLERRR